MSQRLPSRRPPNLYEPRPTHRRISVHFMKKLLGVLFLLPLTTFAASYYVTQSGSGAANGTSSANAWSLGTYQGSSAPTGGDTVFFSGTFTSTVNLNRSGTGNGAARLTYDFTAATLTNANPRILIGGNYVNVSGGMMSTSTGNADLVDFNGQMHDVTISGWNYGPADQTSQSTFIGLENCYNLLVTNNHMDGICFMWGDSTLNHDVVISNNFMRTPVNPNGVDVQLDVIRVGDMANMTIEGNYIENQSESTANNGHDDCIQNYTKGGSNGGSPTNWVVRYNYLVMNDHTGGSGDNSFFMMQSMDGNPALVCYGNVFEVPVGATTGNNGVAVTRDNGGTYYFYNNTFVRHGSAGGNSIEFEDTGTFYAENNVCEADPGIGSAGINWLMTKGVWYYNFFYNWPDGQTTGVAAAGPHGSTSMNPTFTNYSGNTVSLATSSPLIGKGDSTIGAAYNQGIATGATWPNPSLVTRPTNSWDAGAFQSGVASSQPVPLAPQDLRIVPTASQ
jgi:hypothetical protein